MRRSLQVEEYEWFCWLCLQAALGTYRPKDNKDDQISLRYSMVA